MNLQTSVRNALLAAAVLVVSLPLAAARPSAADHLADLNLTQDPIQLYDVPAPPSLLAISDGRRFLVKDHGVEPGAVAMEYDHVPRLSAAATEMAVGNWDADSGQEVLVVGDGGSADLLDHAATGYQHLYRFPYHVTAATFSHPLPGDGAQSIVLAVRDGAGQPGLLWFGDAFHDPNAPWVTGLASPARHQALSGLGGEGDQPRRVTRLEQFPRLPGWPYPDQSVLVTTVGGGPDPAAAARQVQPWLVNGTQPPVLLASPPARTDPILDAAAKARAHCENGGCRPVFAVETVPAGGGTPELDYYVSPDARLKGPSCTASHYERATLEFFDDLTIGCVRVDNGNTAPAVTLMTYDYERTFPVASLPARGEIVRPSLHFSTSADRNVMSVGFTQRSGLKDRLVVTGADLTFSGESPQPRRPVMVAERAAGPEAAAHAFVPVEMDRIKVRVKLKPDKDIEVVGAGKPVPVAVLTAPPQVKGLGQEGTAFTLGPIYTTGTRSGKEETDSFRFRAGVVVGFELEDPLGISGTDIEASLVQESGWDQSYATENILADHYAGDQRHDAVVAVEQTMWKATYEVVSASDGLRVQDDVEILYPRTTTMTALLVDRFRQLHPDAISDAAWRSVLTHDVGNPGTYLGEDDVEGYCADPPGGAFPPLETGPHNVHSGQNNSEGSRIEVSETSSTTAEVSGSVDATVALKILYAKAGATFGFTAGKQWTQTLGKSQAFEGFVGHIPYPGFGHETYEWGAFLCKKSLDGFPVFVFNYWTGGYRGIGGYEDLGPVEAVRPKSYQATTTTPELVWGSTGTIRNHIVEVEAIDQERAPVRLTTPDACRVEPTSRLVCSEPIRRLTVPRLQSGVSYRWRARSVGYLPDPETGEFNEGGPSEWAYFTAWDPPAGTFPVSSTPNLDRSLSVDWTPPSNSRGWTYDVAVARNNRFTDLVQEELGVEGRHWRSRPLAVGTYHVRVVGRNPLGRSDPATTIVEVRNWQPFAGFSWSPQDPLTSDEVSFTDTSSDPDGTIAERHWDFGDGTTSTEANPRHRYTDEGPRTVRLRVTDSDGSSAELSRQITVRREADLGLTVSDSPDPVSRLGTVTYAVDATNRGPTDARDLRVVVDVPAGLPLVSATASAGGQCAAPSADSLLAPALSLLGLGGGPQRVDCTWPGFTEAHAARTIQVTASVPLTAPPGSTFTTTAQVASPTHDPEPGDNRAAAVTTVR